jgi:hypothetical protein
MSVRSASAIDRARLPIRIAHGVTMVVALATAATLAGCGGDVRTEREQVVAQDSARRAAIASTEATAAPPIALTHERDADLTGDRIPELLRVTARGTRPESLAVTLSVRDSSGATLYRESWMAGTWLARIDPAVLTPAIADSIVRRRIDDLFGDDAITRPATPNPTVVDPRVVALDVAERRWRASNRVADSIALPEGGRDAIAAAARDTLRVRALVAELRRQPSLGWLQGDGRQAIAWSPTERRFVRVRRCC